jgi:hypothetical protein
VRVLFYTGLKFNFYDVLVMAMDERVMKEQVEEARKRIALDSSFPIQRRLNFEMSVRNLYTSLRDRERVQKIQGLLNECMTFLDDQLSVLTGPYEQLLRRMSTTVAGLNVSAGHSLKLGSRAPIFCTACAPPWRCYRWRSSASSGGSIIAGRCGSQRR